MKNLKKGSVNMNSVSASDHPISISSYLRNTETFNSDFLLSLFRKTYTCSTSESLQDRYIIEQRVRRLAEYEYFTIIARDSLNLNRVVIMPNNPRTSKLNKVFIEFIKSGDCQTFPVIDNENVIRFFEVLFPRRILCENVHPMTNHLYDNLFERYFNFDSDKELIVTNLSRIFSENTKGKEEIDHMIKSIVGESPIKFTNESPIKPGAINKKIYMSLEDQTPTNKSYGAFCSAFGRFTKDTAYVAEITPENIKDFITTVFPPKLSVILEARNEHTVLNFIPCDVLNALFKPYFWHDVDSQKYS
jgi:hypothetical protein